MSISITIEDNDAGTTETVAVPDDNYIIVTSGACEVHHVQAHATGTHVLTVRGVKS